MTNETGGPGGSTIEMFDYVWERITGRLEGLTDAEYFWEPVTGCWSLRRDSEDHWVLDGGGGGGPAPTPAPFTTIAWRVGHLAGLAVGGFADRLFGEGAQPREGINFPATAADVPSFLTENYGRWRSGMTDLAPEDWARPLGDAWGPYAESTVLDLALHVADEVIHHGAEVALLRDLYEHREDWRP